MIPNSLNIGTLPGIPGGMEIPSPSGKSSAGVGFADLFQEMMLDQMSGATKAPSLSLQKTGKGKSLGFANSFTPVQNPNLGLKKSFGAPRRKGLYGLNEPSKTGKPAGNVKQSSSYQMDRAERAKEQRQADKVQNDSRMDDVEKIREFWRKAHDLARKNKVSNGEELLQLMKKDPRMDEVLAGLDEEQALKLSEAVFQEIASHVQPEGESPKNEEALILLDESSDPKGFPNVENPDGQITSTSEAVSDSQVEEEKEAYLLELLETLRRDSEQQDFWKSLDDKTAVEVLKGMLTPSENLSGEATGGNAEESLNYMEFGPRERRRLDSLKMQAELREKSGKDEDDAESGITEDPEPLTEKPSGDGSLKNRAAFLKSREAEEQAAEGKIPPEGFPAGTATGAETAGVVGQGNSSTATLGAPPAGPSFLEMMQKLGQKSENGRQPAPEKILLTVPAEAGKIRREGSSGSHQSGFGNGFMGKHFTREVYNESRQTQSQEPIRSTIFSQLVERAYLLKGPQAQKTMTIQLKPEFLGKVQLELTSKDGTVTARIMTENAQVRDRIEELAPQIKTHLAEQGVNLDNLTVDVSTRNPDGREGGSSSEAPYESFRFGGRRKAFVGPETVVEVSGPVLNPALPATGVDITI